MLSVNLLNEISNLEEFKEIKELVAELQVNKLSAVMQWPCAIELPSEFTSFISHQRPPTNLTSVVNCRRLLNAEIVCLFVFLNN